MASKRKDRLYKPTSFPHFCRRHRCLSEWQLLPNGKRHYPHKGAQCHAKGEDPSRCPIHGSLLQFVGGRDFGNRYPAGVCYQCLPAHRPVCPMVTMPAGFTCTCPDRLAALGQSTHKDVRTELRPSA